MPKNKIETIEGAVWFEELGFKENPFTIKPGFFDDEILGYDSKLAKFYLSIRIDAVWFVSGNYGAGKTSLLKSIISKNDFSKKVIYYSTNRKDRTLNLKKFLINKSGFFCRIIKRMPRNVILLLDEAQRLDRYECNQIVEYYRHGNLKSIVFASDRFESVKFTPELLELIGENFLDLNVVSKDVGILIVRKRFPDAEFLSDNIIKKIVDLSDNNPRTILENCEDICRYAVENKADKVTISHLNIVSK